MPKIGQLCCGVKVKKHTIKKASIKKAPIRGVKNPDKAGGHASAASKAASAAAKKVATAAAKSGRCICPKKHAAPRGLTGL